MQRFVTLSAFAMILAAAPAAAQLGVGGSLGSSADLSAAGGGIGGSASLDASVRAPAANGVTDVKRAARKSRRDAIDEASKPARAQAELGAAASARAESGDN